MIDVTAETKQLRVTVRRLACDDVTNVCRTVDYAAKEMGVQVASFRCRPELAHFEALLAGRETDVASVRAILTDSFPEAEVVLEAVGR